MVDYENLKTIYYEVPPSCDFCSNDAALRNVVSRQNFCWIHLDRARRTRSVNVEKGWRKVGQI